MTEINKIELLIPDYNHHPLAARYVGTVQAHFRDSVTDEWVEYYHSVDIHRPTGEWNNLWLPDDELLDYLCSARDFAAVR
jgi:hypothetical protein